MDDFDGIDLAAVRAFLARKEAVRREGIARRLAQADEDAARIIAHIADNYRPRRIYQWGSLVDRQHFSEISDIDLALEGVVSPEEFQALLGDAMGMTELPLDIVQLERIPPDTADWVRHRGRLVYERR